LFIWWKSRIFATDFSSWLMRKLVFCWYFVLKCCAGSTHADLPEGAVKVWANIFRTASYNALFLVSWTWEIQTCISKTLQSRCLWRGIICPVSVLRGSCSLRHTWGCIIYQRRERHYSVCFYTQVFSGPKKRTGRVRVHALFVSWGHLRPEVSNLSFADSISTESGILDWYEDLSLQPSPKQSENWCPGHLKTIKMSRDHRLTDKER
jgi:hypothetical protein